MIYYRPSYLSQRARQPNCERPMKKPELLALARDGLEQFGARWFLLAPAGNGITANGR